MTPHVPSAEVSAAPVIPSTAVASGSAGYIDAEFVDVRRRHLREYLWILYKYRWLAATCFGIVFGLTCVFTLLAGRVYTATTRLQVTSQSPIQLQLDQNVLRDDDKDRMVNGTSSFVRPPNSTRKNSSCSLAVWKKAAAAWETFSILFRMLPLASRSKPTETGASSAAKAESVCSIPSSDNRKLSIVKPVIGVPMGFVT